MKYKKKGYYDILKGISGHVTLVKLMGLLGNMNHAISVVGYWIFDSKYKKSLVLNRLSLDMIFPHLLVKNNLLNLKQYLLQGDTYAMMRN